MIQRTFERDLENAHRIVAIARCGECNERIASTIEAIVCSEKLALSVEDLEARGLRFRFDAFRGQVEDNGLTLLCREAIVVLLAGIRKRAPDIDWQLVEPGRLRSFLHNELRQVIHKQLLLIRCTRGSNQT